MPPSRFKKILLGTPWEFISQPLPESSLNEPQQPDVALVHLASTSVFPVTANSTYLIVVWDDDQEERLSGQLIQINETCHASKDELQLLGPNYRVNNPRVVKVESEYSVVAAEKRI